MRILEFENKVGQFVIKLYYGNDMKFIICEPSSGWRHPGGKLIEKGAEKVTDAELLAILISTGIKGKSAETIANEIMNKFVSFKGIANQPLNRIAEIKGLGDVKVVRIAAAFEIARRIVNQVLKDNEQA